MTIKASVNEFVPMLQSLLSPLNRDISSSFHLQLSGLSGLSTAAIGVHVKTLFQNFFGNRLIATYQYRVGTEHVFFVTVNHFNDPEGNYTWGRAFNA